MGARQDRFLLLQQKEDLDKSIVHGTEAILLSPAHQVGLSVNVVQLLFRLAHTLLFRAMMFRHPEDAKSSIKYFQYLQGLPLHSFGVPRNDVVRSLTLALQIGSETDGTQNHVETMVAHCRKLLASHTSTDFPVDDMISLINAVFFEFNTLRQVRSIDQVVECVRDMVKMCPGSRLALSVLANTLCIRFMTTHSNDDYEEATALLEKALDPNQPGESSYFAQDIVSLSAALLAYTKSAFFQNPGSSEMATSHLRTLHSSSSFKGFRPVYIDILASQATERFNQYSLAESLEEANSYTSQLLDLSSEPSQSPGLFGDRLSGRRVRESLPTTRVAEKIQHLKELLSDIPPGTGRHRECLRKLVDWHETKFLRTNDTSDIEEAIKYGRLALNATHPSDLSRHLPLGSLRNIFLTAFEGTNTISYLDEAIVLGYEMLELNVSQHFDFPITKQLVSCLLTRERLLGQKKDRQEAIRLISMVIDNQYAREPDRFRLSCLWTILARSIAHPTTSTAYKAAMSLIQKSSSFAPTVSIQHTRLVAMGKNFQDVPLDYASYQISLGRFEEAIETLEQGRALLWSEMRGLRTHVAQLNERDSPCAKRFAEINQELETLTISVTPASAGGRSDVESRDGMDPFGRLVVKRQQLVAERDELISQIRRQPGLEGILKAPSFDALRSAASRGPVMLINHCIWRSDILILFHNSLPCAVPTPNDFYNRANKLRDELVAARKHGLNSAEYQDALCSVLKGLYELVGVPAIKRLRVLGIPEQSRIWLCPTSVFCSLPLHAMGPIPSSDAGKPRYFSDLYIPSYTPSLSALIESRKSSPEIIGKPSLLLVAQPDHSLPGVKGEIKVIRSLEPRVTVADLVSSEATPSSVVEGLQGSQFAHFACHGLLETGKPFEACFRLHEGSRLTLLEIVRSRLPDAQFAFLSCCHAAEITQESVADEALHLTAAMQYCGFRSVVGTMWEMADTDGRDLAKSFYKSLFASQEAGVPYYERSAKALRDATQKLRGKRGVNLERWVNFVHYGA
ncbi:CHAT domain containing protein [Lactarius tabidus]|jgi:tetratricopeptide (TPR) repeat protein